MSEEKKVRKKESPKVWKFYQLKGSSLVRSRKECPRCGKGVFLAEHTDRVTCGKCGYTLFKKSE
ncbi:MAG: 30S ribosomal protein S27ae [Nitrososphaerales archaeon]